MTSPISALGGAIPNLTVTPGGGTSASTAAGAYGQVDQGNFSRGFSSMLDNAVQGVIDAGHTADAQTVKAISGGGNITEVVTAVQRAELAMQATGAIRDRVVQAYQDIMKMPI
jgi:flagellar hook-basal body complex protein FliE